MRGSSFSNAHIFEATVSRSMAQRRLVDEFLGLFGGRMQPVMAHLVEAGKLTLEDVQEVAKKYLDPKRMHLIAAGAIDESGKPIPKAPPPKR